MKPTRSLAFAFVAVCSLAACGGGGDDDSTAAPDANTTVPDGTPGSTQLTVKNFLSWCSVSVNGAAAATTATQTVTVDPGTIDLVATAASATFEIGPGMWHHTDGDTGTGDDGTVSGDMSTAQVTVGADATCVWVCCPFASDGSGCDVAEQCN
jgi:hypothetical protein